MNSASAPVDRRTPVRLRLSRAKGFSLDATSRAVNGLPAIKVDRTTKWGNIFVVGKHGDQARCVELHRYLVLGGLIAMTDGPSYEEQLAYLRRVTRDASELRGSNLACWCREGTPCHVDNYLELADRPLF